VKSRSWEDHYTSARSELRYPDENLVRLLRKSLAGAVNISSMTAADLGCGSGRHMKLLHELGIPDILGMDASHNALLISKNSGSGSLLQGNINHIPLKNSVADIVIAWGSLHYAVKDELAPMLREIRRVLKDGGSLFATLRSSRDTYLKRGKHLGNDTWITDLDDIKGSIASFYSESEIRASFSKFSEYRCGLMERTIMGDLSSLISHWIIEARK
jgi:SAM-dependent methyltransferase